MTFRHSNRIHSEHHRREHSGNNRPDCMCVDIWIPTWKKNVRNIRWSGACTGVLYHFGCFRTSKNTWLPHPECLGKRHVLRTSKWCARNIEKSPTLADVSNIESLSVPHSLSSCLSAPFRWNDWRNEIHLSHLNRFESIAEGIWSHWMRCSCPDQWLVHRKR